MRPNQIATAKTTVKVHTGPSVSTPQVSGLPILSTDQSVTVLDVQTIDGTSWTQVQDAYTGLSGYAQSQYLTLEYVTCPVFLPDLYWHDAGGKPDWSKLFLDPRYIGAILKASQGTSMDAGESAWFIQQWSALADAGGASLGQTWYRGAYHFLMLSPPSGQTPTAFGQAQAQYFLDTLQRAGGLAATDLPPIVDVENSAASGNQSSSQIVEEIASAWAATVQQASGRKPMLYRRYTDSDWPGLTSKMGCAFLWAKRYNRTLGPLGNGFPSAALWQYTDGFSNLTDLPAGYPYTLPGIGPIDTSTVQYGDGTAAAVQELIAASQ